MTAKKNLRKCLIVLFSVISITSHLLAPIPKALDGKESRPLKEIYKKSLVAMRNVVDVKSELKDKINTIEEEKVALEQKKRVLRAAAKEIESIFPRTGVDIDSRAQGMIKHLKEFEHKGKIARQPKSNKAIALGIISGVLISSVLGLVIWKRVDSRSKRDSRTKEGMFIDTITRYLESNR